MSMSMMKRTPMNPGIPLYIKNYEWDEYRRTHQLVSLAKNEQWYCVPDWVINNGKNKRKGAFNVSTSDR